MVLFVIFERKITKSTVLFHKYTKSRNKILENFTKFFFEILFIYLLFVDCWFVQVSDRIASERNSITSKTEKMKNELLFFKEKFISGEGIPKGRDLLFLSRAPNFEKIPWPTFFAQNLESSCFLFVASLQMFIYLFFDKNFSDGKTIQLTPLVQQHQQKLLKDAEGDLTRQNLFG